MVAMKVLLDFINSYLKVKNSSREKLLEEMLRFLAFLSLPRRFMCSSTSNVYAPKAVKVIFHYCFMFRKILQVLFNSSEVMS